MERKLTHHSEADGRRANVHQRREVEVVGREQRLEEQLVSQGPDESGVPLLDVVAHGLAVRDWLLVSWGWIARVCRFGGGFDV